MIAPHALLLAAAVSGAPLRVTVENIRDDKGHVLVAVCTQAEFLKPHCSYQGSAPARAGSVTVEVRNVPPGTYAVEAYQDENDNHRLDRNLLGLPTEGIGFSNDARFNFGPPSFSDAQIALGPAGGRIVIRLRYF
jgi:uncharacterized protein (DUF2141 family)